MSEKKTISGVRTDLSPSEFSAKLNRSTKSSKSFKGTFGKINYILSALGIMPMLTSDTGSKGHRGHGRAGGAPHPVNSFKESYRVDMPPRRTHEDMVREHIAHDAYMDMVDGKGDYDR